VNENNIEITIILISVLIGFCLGVCMAIILTPSPVAPVVDSPPPCVGEVYTPGTCGFDSGMTFEQCNRTNTTNGISVITPDGVGGS
jgi:hypothetical protein